MFKNLVSTEKNHFIIIFNVDVQSLSRVTEICLSVTFCFLAKQSTKESLENSIITSRLRLYVKASSLLFQLKVNFGPAFFNKFYE